jgi:hypothetical protein
MGITPKEFAVAMETYGAERLGDRLGSEVDNYVPYYNVAGTNFYHSGSNYIVWDGKKISDEIMSHIMREVLKKHPKEVNLLHGKIYSIKELLTLSAMIENKYTKEFVDELVNKTYQKILDCSAIKSNFECQFKNTHLPKMEELCKLLNEYNSIVNPFGSALKLKDPVWYCDTIAIDLIQNKYMPNYTLTLSYEQENDINIQAIFHSDPSGWSYTTSMYYIEKNLYVYVDHIYTNGSNGSPEDETIGLLINDYTLKQSSIINLKISLKTGLASSIGTAENAELATNEQIKVMLENLTSNITKVKNKIICNMVEA